MTDKPSASGAAMRGVNSDVSPAMAPTFMRRAAGVRSATGPERAAGALTAIQNPQGGVFNMLTDAGQLAFSLSINDQIEGQVFVGHIAGYQSATEGSLWLQYGDRVRLVVRSEFLDFTGEVGADFLNGALFSTNNISEPTCIHVDYWLKRTEGERPPAAAWELALAGRTPRLPLDIYWAADYSIIQEKVAVNPTAPSLNHLVIRSIGETLSSSQVSFAKDKKWEPFRVSGKVRELRVYSIKYSYVTAEGREFCQGPVVEYARVTNKERVYVQIPQVETDALFDALGRQMAVDLVRFYIATGDTGEWALMDEVPVSELKAGKKVLFPANSNFVGLGAQQVRLSEPQPTSPSRAKDLVAARERLCLLGPNADYYNELDVPVVAQVLKGAPRSSYKGPAPVYYPVQGSTANPVNRAFGGDPRQKPVRAFKSGGSYKFAIAYEDAYGRLGPAILVGEVDFADHEFHQTRFYPSPQPSGRYFETPGEMFWGIVTNGSADEGSYAHIGYTGILDIYISHRAPLWASRVRLLQTENLAFGKYLQTAASVFYWYSTFVDVEGVYDTDIYSLEPPHLQAFDLAECRGFAFSLRSYEPYVFEKGQTVVVRNNLGEALFTSEIEFERGGFIYVRADALALRTADLNSRLGIIPTTDKVFGHNIGRPGECLLEIRNLASPNLGQTIYNDTNYTKDVVGGQDFSHFFNPEGDIWVYSPFGFYQRSKRALMLRIDPEGNRLFGANSPGNMLSVSVSMVYESHHPYIPWDQFSDRGKRRVVAEGYPAATQRAGDNIVSYSETMLRGTRTVNINYFPVKNQESTPATSGPGVAIVRAKDFQAEADSLHVIHPQGVTSLYLGNVAMRQAGGALFAATENFIGDVYPLATDYGTSSMRNVSTNGTGNVYFFDEAAQELCRVGKDGITPLGKTHLFARELERLGKVSYTTGAFDKRRSEFWLVVRNDRGEQLLLVFSESQNWLESVSAIGPLPIDYLVRGATSMVLCQGPAFYSSEPGVFEADSLDEIVIENPDIELEFCERMEFEKDFSAFQISVAGFGSATFRAVSPQLKANPPASVSITRHGGVEMLNLTPLAGIKTKGSQGLLSLKGTKDFCLYSLTSKHNILSS